MQTGFAGVTPKPTPQQPTPPTAPQQPNLQQALSSGQQLNPLQFSSYRPEAGQTDPRDATYWENLNKLLFTAQTEYGKGLQAQQLSDVNWGATQQQEEVGRQRAERTLAEQMIGRGLAYSGAHNVGQAQRQTDWLSRMGGLTRTKQAEDAARNAAQMAIAQGFSIDEAALLAEAVARQAEAQAEQAAEGPPELEYGLEAGGGTPQRRRRKKRRR